MESKESSWIGPSRVPRASAARLSKSGFFRAASTSLNGIPVGNDPRFCAVCSASAPPIPRSVLRLPKLELRCSGCKSFIEPPSCSRAEAARSTRSSSVKRPKPCFVCTSPLALALLLSTRALYCVWKDGSTRRSAFVKRLKASRIRARRIPSVRRFRSRCCALLTFRLRLPAPPAEATLAMSLCFPAESPVIVERTGEEDTGAVFECSRTPGPPVLPPSMLSLPCSESRSP